MIKTLLFHYSSKKEFIFNLEDLLHLKHGRFRGKVSARVRINKNTKKGSKLLLEKTSRLDDDLQKLQVAHSCFKMKYKVDGNI